MSSKYREVFKLCGFKGELIESKSFKERYESILNTKLHTNLTKCNHPESIKDYCSSDCPLLKNLDKSTEVW